MFRAAPVKRVAATAALSGGIAVAALGAASAPALAKTTHTKPAKKAATSKTAASKAAASKAALTQLTNSGASDPLASLMSYVPPFITNITPTDGQSASANFSNGPMSVSYTASTAPGGGPNSAQGTFTAQLAEGSNTLFQISGPVTCLNVQGSYVGLFYPVTSSVPAGIGSFMKGVYVSVQMGPNGPMTFSFRPSTTTTATDAGNCAPMPTFVPIASGTGSSSS